MLAGTAPPLLGGTPFITPAMAFGNDGYTQSLLHLDATLTDAALGHRGRTWSYRLGSNSLQAAALGVFSQCGYLDGSTVIQTPCTLDAMPGSKDFTLDFWAFTQAAVGGCIWGIFDSTLNYAPFCIFMQGGNLTIYASSNGTSWDVFSSGAFATPTPDGWHHVAIVRQGGNWKFFLDGVNTNNSGGSGALYSPPNSPQITIGGQAPSNGNLWVGYIDEVRWTVGLARWTAAFTPPQRPYFGPLSGENDEATVTLLKFDGGLRDVAAGLEIVSGWSQLGGACISPNPANGKFGYAANFGSSAIDAFAAGQHPARIWDMANHEWTIDFWYNRASATGANHGVFAHRTSGTVVGPWMIYLDTANNLSFYSSADNSTWAASGVAMGNATAGVWVHFAVQHVTNVLWTFRNGVLVSSVTYNGMTNALCNTWIGGEGAGAGNASLNGNLDEFRISHIGRYGSGGFTPPAAPYGPDPLAAVDQFTRILLHLDGTNGATTFPDSGCFQAAYPHAWAGGGGAALTTTGPKFGTACLNLNGSQWIAIAPTPDLFQGAGDFTIDAWFSIAGGAGTIRHICGQCDSLGSANTDLANLLRLDASNKLQGYACIGAVANVVQGTTAITATGWHHAALVRSGAVMKLFLDGVQEGGDVSIGATAILNASTKTFSIGRLGENNGYYWNGQIDEFRYTVGNARWTANFTPPAAPYS